MIGAGRFARALPAVLMALGSAAALSGCSFMESLFPDKQKEYRYSTELPPLEVPPDLGSSDIEGARAESGSGSSEREQAAEESAASETEGGEAEVRDSRRGSDAGKSVAPTATLAQGSDDVPLIEVEAPFAETWNDVSRALGRLEVEVSDQNRSDGVFYVYYGGETKKYVDRGLWQDFASLFSDGGSKAQEFRLKLEGRDEVTNVFVLDKEGKPVSDGPGLDLLKRLHEKLQNLDKPEPEKEQPESKNEQ